LLLGLRWWGAAKFIVMTIEKVFGNNIFYDLRNIQLEVEEMAHTEGAKYEGGPLNAPWRHSDLPVNINIQRDQPLEFRFSWEQSGWMVDRGSVQDFFDNYMLEIVFEKIGRDMRRGDSRDRTFNERVAVVSDPTVNATVTVPANALGTGLYKVMVVFNLNDVDDDGFVAAFKEVGLINVFKQTK
jgi:hypothetical protein